MEKTRVVIDVPDPDTWTMSTEIVFNGQVIPLNLVTNPIAGITLEVRAGDIPRLKIEHISRSPYRGSSDA